MSSAAPTVAEFPKDAWALLSPMLTPERRSRMLAVVAARTRFVRLVIQDIHHPHNVSACLRSADAFGVQDVDVVTLRESFKASTVARGVANWLTLRRHTDVAACVAQLRASGYRIYAGVPAPSAQPLASLSTEGPVAVVFGNEHAGIENSWHEHIDQAFTIPMVGMVESLNISVGAAITLQQLTLTARTTVAPERYNLSSDEQTDLLNAWICRQMSSWPQLLARLRT